MKPLPRVLSFVSLLAVLLVGSRWLVDASYLPLPENALEFVSAGSTGFNPANGDVRYFGLQGGLAASTGADTGYSVIAPITGTFVKAYVTTWVNGTLGSNESVTITIRNVTANTTANITTSATWTAQENVLSNTAMNTAVTAGDQIQIKLTCPTWGTVPTQVFLWIRLVIR